MEVGKKYKYSNCNVVYTCLWITPSGGAVVSWGKGEAVLDAKHFQFYVEVKEPRQSEKRYVGVVEFTDRSVGLTVSTFSIRAKMIGLEYGGGKIIDLIEVQWTEKNE